MRLNTRRALACAVVFLSALLLTVLTLPAVQAAADHVRWDIIHFNPATNKTWKTMAYGSDALDSRDRLGGAVLATISLGK